MSEHRRGYKWIAAEIQRLHPVADADRIVALTIARTAPPSMIATHLTYTLGFLRFCASPDQSIAVHRHGRGMIYTQGDRRADETSFHMSMWLDGSASPEQISASIARVRRKHEAIGRSWPMPERAFVHGACAFALTPDLFLTRVLGAPGLSRNEKIAQVTRWCAISQQLGITGVPQSWDDMQTYLDAHEHSDAFAYCEEGAQLAQALLDQFARRWFPRPMQGAARQFVLALTEPHVLDTIGLQPPPAPFTAAMRTALRAGVFLKSHVLPDPRGTANVADRVASHPRSAITSAT
jgi:hypothetical protein